MAPLPGPRYALHDVSDECRTLVGAYAMLSVMFEVSEERIATMGSVGQYKVPTAVDLKCPQCRRDVTFTLGSWNNSQCQGLPVAARCPRCGEPTRFIRLEGTSKQDLRLYVDADPPERTPLAGLPLVPKDRFSPRLRKAYESALRALANSDAEATAVHCRRVLEGVTASMLSPGDDPPRQLARRLEVLAKNHADLLSQPILELSRSLKDGGNLGAHFDDEEDTTPEDAEHMVELLDNLLTYLFVLPERIKRFRLDVLGESDSGE